MLEFDSDAVRQNAVTATDEDLLDRVTAFRAGMERPAVDIIEIELLSRGIGPADIERHAAEHCANVVQRPEGFAYKCGLCRRPAVVRTWGWHWLWGLLPVLPCLQSYCAQHAPKGNDNGN